MDQKDHSFDDKDLTKFEIHELQIKKLQTGHEFRKTARFFTTTRQVGVKLIDAFCLLKDTNDDF